MQPHTQEQASAMRVAKNKLQRLHELVQICAFAVNAERVLIHSRERLKGTSEVPHLPSMIAGVIDDYDDGNTVSVLNHIANELAVVYCELDEIAAT